MSRSLLLAIALLLGPLAITVSAQAAAPGSSAETASGPTVDRAWARETPGAARTSAAYFRITSPTEDRLVGLATPVARKAELHTTSEQNGVMEMRAVEGGLPLPAGQTVELKPGTALHVMLVDLVHPLKAGESFPLTLSFAKAASRTIQVQVERLGAMGPSGRAGAKSSDASELGGAFTLVDQDGRSVSDTMFRGRWMLVYFGYTHCPDACPTALTEMAGALDDLDPSIRPQVQAIFITVDPDRDTVSVMRDYVGAFEDAHIAGLTGSDEQIAQAMAAYRIYAKRRDQPDGDYSMAHTSAIHIMDPEGQFVTLAQPGQLAAKLASVLP
jgi:protein SCO1/2